MSASFFHPLLMAIINITPDSFSDGGQYSQTEQIFINIQSFIEQGAKIIDIGAESTRPGAKPVSKEEELQRLSDFLSAFQKRNFPSDIIFSIDTYKSEIARAALQAGFTIVNDVYGSARDPDILNVTAEYNATYILGHHSDTIAPDCDLITNFCERFESVGTAAIRAGVKPEKIFFDPGIGFGKTFEQNLMIINQSDEIKKRTGAEKIVIGASRKSFIGKILKIENPQNRLIGSVVCGIIAAQKGADILRVHDVKAHHEAFETLHAVTREGKN